MQTCKDRGYCTVCIMNNSNGNLDGNIFCIDGYNCKSARLIHNNVNEFFIQNKVNTLERR